MHTWLLHVLQTTDSLFPTGSYAHSYGLEGLVQAGVVRDVATCLEALEHIVAPGLAQVELPFVRLAHAPAQAGDVPRLQSLGDRCHAVKLMRELREASLGVGRQRLAMLSALAPSPLLAALAGAAAQGDLQPHGPIITGVEFAVCDAPCEAALQACIYQAGAAWISASMKLFSVGQTAAQRALRTFLLTGPEILARSLTVAETEIGVFSPVLDIASARHESADSRLFIS